MFFMFTCSLGIMKHVYISGQNDTQFHFLLIDIIGSISLWYMIFDIFKLRIIISNIIH